MNTTQGDTRHHEALECEAMTTIGDDSKDATGRLRTPDDASRTYTLEEVQAHVDQAYHEASQCLLRSSNVAFIDNQHELYARLKQIAADIQQLKGHLPSI